MSEKEFFLIAAIIFSLIIMLLTFKKLNKLNLSNSKKSIFIYITIIVPVLGYLLVSRTKSMT